MSFQAGINKSSGTRDFISDAHWIIKKAKEHEKKSLCALLNYRKVFDCVNHIKLWNVLRKMGIPGHLIVLTIEMFT